MDNKTQLKISKEELSILEEYRNAYYYLLEHWDSFNKEQQKQINKDLNKIFVLNEGERVYN